ncbi:phosphogluconate dehydrogenase C-terminal domain-containing protein [Rhizobium miluonense]|uniref:NADP oxidoreductase coenzyme F420-dependent n=1 Tax=Rhizobium miluonense TaxID=411945 RepID=A0A1C3V7Z5_9HYPH|nr:phosphogluconate dehydrogenase C-terminal domain-containing protein [Rhizobium miluonense]SCB23704.1 NADP oxidoreductase coenzyme F420-dependent [Rhizobium miluonense]
MNKVILLGAGGKMGMRLARNLSRSAYEVIYAEVNAERRAAFEAELGRTCTGDVNFSDCDAVILAVPDNAIGRIAAQIAPELRAGTVVIVLDAAAPYAGDMPDRSDLSYFIAHPCHPSMFNWEADETAARDTFGGAGARQAIVCALMQGPEEHFAFGADLASCFYAPVSQVHRATVEQMAILEPVLSETVVATCLTLINEAILEAEKRGVPYVMARDFTLGHIYAESAIIFGHIKGTAMSDGCLKAIEDAKPKLLNPEWRQVFEKDEMVKSIKSITQAV